VRPGLLGADAESSPSARRKIPNTFSPAPFLLCSLGRVSELFGAREILFRLGLLTLFLVGQPRIEYAAAKREFKRMLRYSRRPPCQIAGPPIKLSPGCSNPRVLRSSRIGLRAIGDGLVILAFIRVGDSTVVVCRSQLWIEPNGRRAVVDGLVKVRRVAIDPATVAVRLGILRVELDGLRAIGNSLGTFALVAEGDASVAVCRRVMGSSRMASVRSAMALSYSPFSL